VQRILILGFVLLGPLHRCIGRSWQETPDTVRNLGIEMRSRGVESASESIDISPFLDGLRQLEENPLEIAAASAAELQQIPGVSPQAAFQIVSYRDQHFIHRKEDLNGLQGIEPEVVEALEPYVSFSGRTSSGRDRPNLSIRMRLVRKLSQSPTSEDDQYLGSPEKVYCRIAGRFGLSSELRKSKEDTHGLNGSSVSFGLLTSKDPGENNFADLLRGNVAAHFPEYSTRLVIGNFLVDGGQGLVFWRSTGFSKGGEATSGVAKNGIGVWPSLSTGQSTAFRGIGVSIQPRGMGFHLFYSNKPLDATIDSEGTATHLSSDDLHRTESELAKKNRLRERTVGGRMTLELGKGIKLGMSGLTSLFDETVMLSGPFGFHGDQFSAFGLDGLYTDGSISAFAEIARDRSRAISAVAGFSANPSSNVSVAFVVRTYAESYNNFHSSGFSESGDGCRNESGTYAGLTFHPTSWLRVTAYVDQFVFPWRTFGSLMSSQGHEYFVAADLRMNDKIAIEFQFRKKDNAESSTTFDVAETNQIGIDSKGRSTCRLMLRFDPAASLRWQNCVEIVNVGLERESVQERGLLFFQDLTADIGHALSVTARIVAFYTDSYASRVYEYEADLPGAYSTPALFDSGFRCYILGRYRWGRTLALALKYSQTSKERTSEGIPRADNQISVQLDLQL
jgi:hypothetical protein